MCSFAASRRAEGRFQRLLFLRHGASNLFDFLPRGHSISFQSFNSVPGNGTYQGLAGRRRGKIISEPPEGDVGPAKAAFETRRLKASIRPRHSQPRFGPFHLAAPFATRRNSQPSAPTSVIASEAWRSRGCRAHASGRPAEESAGCRRRRMCLDRHAASLLAMTSHPPWDLQPGLSARATRNPDSSLFNALRRQSQPGVTAKAGPLHRPRPEERRLWRRVSKDDSRARRTSFETPASRAPQDEGGVKKPTLGELQPGVTPKPSAPPAVIASEAWRSRGCPCFGTFGGEIRRSPEAGISGSPRRFAPRDDGDQLGSYNAAKLRQGVGLVAALGLDGGEAFARPAGIRLDAHCPALRYQP